MTKREVYTLAFSGFGVTVAGLSWLLGPIPLIVAGVVMFAAALFIDF